MTKVVKFPNFFPKGYIWISTDKTNPSKWFGGTWTSFGQGRVLVGIDPNQSEFNAVNKTGGEKKHLLTAGECGIREHTHKLPLSTNAGVGSYNDVPYRAQASGSVDNSFRTGRITGISNLPNDYGAPILNGTNDVNALTSHNNLQPYIVVYMFQRTA